MLNKKVIVIIGAMECEISLIKDFLQDVISASDSPFNEFIGKVNNTKVIVAKSGVGKVAAASCTQYLINKYAPDCIFNTGVAGGIDNKLKIGDIVIGKSFVEHDFNVTALGYSRGYVCNGIEPQKPTVFEADKDLVEKFYQLMIEILPKENIHIGRIVSGDIFIADKNRKQNLFDFFGATAAEMESAAIAHCAELNKVPFVAIRAISDLANGEKIENYPEFEEKAAKISADILKTILLK